MKIILSPSKTQNIRSLFDISNNEVKDISTLVAELAPVIEDEKFLKKQRKMTRELVGQLKTYEEAFIAKKMKLKGDLLAKVMKDYKDFNKRSVIKGAAALSYTGTVFKELKVSSYDEKAFRYMHKHLMVLSALYGPTPAFAPIQSYRLDMTMSLFDTNLYSFWKDVYIKRFAKEDIIIDLASVEFSKQIQGKKLSFEFLQPVKEGYKAIAFHSKQGRGLMANYLIQNQIEDIEEIKLFHELGYVFDQESSSEMNYVFKKN